MTENPDDAKLPESILDLVTPALERCSALTERLARLLAPVLLLS